MTTPAVLNSWDGVSAPITYMGASLVPPTGQRNFSMTQTTVHIHNGRHSNFKLDTNGFELLDATTTLSTEQFYTDHHAITSTYYQECCTLLQQKTGASKVFAFDHNVRNAGVATFAERSKAKTKTLARPDGPVRFVHNDYTNVSGPQRVRDLSIPGGSYTKQNALLSKEEAARIVTGTSRYCFVNVWRPINQPVNDVPLAVCDAQSMLDEDFTACQLVYENRIGETYIVQHQARHQWHWFPNMNKNEALLLKCWDSEQKGTCSAHSAFENRNASKEAPPRESIEVRCLLVFDGSHEGNTMQRLHVPPHRSNL